MHAHHYAAYAYHISFNIFFSPPHYDLLISSSNAILSCQTFNNMHDPTLLVEDARIFIQQHACLPAYFCRQPHIHCDTHALNANSKTIAAKLVNTLTKMPRIHYRHLHQHQQPFVTLNSPSLFDTAPQIRCIPQITYPELEAEEPRASHKQRQLAEPLIYLFLFLFSFPPPCEIQYRPHFPIRLFSPGLLRQFSQSAYLLYTVCFSAPSKNYPPCTPNSICFTLVIHICFFSTSLINIASPPDHLDQMLLPEQSYNRPRSTFRGLDGLILRPT